MIGDDEWKRIAKLLQWSKSQPKGPSPRKLKRYTHGQVFDMSWMTREERRIFEAARQRLE